MMKKFCELLNIEMCHATITAVGADMFRCTLHEIDYHLDILCATKSAMRKVFFLNYMKLFNLTNQ